jgi:2,4-dienoyl-CoA reductase-like NADH-dependent reductase (Old Yellow Enzyme family)
MSKTLFYQPSLRNSPPALTAQYYEQRATAGLINRRYFVRHKSSSFNVPEFSEAQTVEISNQSRS